MSGDFESLIEPIENASRPGTLAGLTLAVLQVTPGEPWFLKFILGIGAIMFLFSALFMFFYTIYPMMKRLWTFTAITFLLGLIGSIISSMLLLLLI